MKALILILILSLAAACQPGDEGESSSRSAAGAAPKKAQEARATRVEVAVVRASRSSIRLVRPGEVVGAREARLASALGGFVERVHVEAGAKVRSGAPVANVDTRTHAAQVELTSVEVAEAERELARLEKLGQAVASARVDEARSRLLRAKAQHEQSLTRRSLAVIRAPFGGVIAALDVERGEVLAPGAPIARLVQLDPIHVNVSVTDRDVAMLRVGGEAEVSTAALAGSLSGKIARIEPAADLNTRTFPVVVEIPNPTGRLLPGMIAQVAFSGGAPTGEALFIPQDFIVTRLEGNGVFLVEEDVARWRPLELGAISGTDVEILSGLEPGEKIVTLGHRSLSDGDRLIVAREGRCCEDGRVIFKAKDDVGPEVSGRVREELSP